MSAPIIAPVCGFDVGSENCYIGVARKGGIEIILNEYSQRTTPAYVSFDDNKRELGVSAKQKQNMNIQKTFFAMKRLVGRQYNHVASSEDLPFPICQSDSGEVAVKVFFGDEEYTFTATQVLAMLLTKLRQIAGNPVDCVINCPNYFTDAQRRAMKDAAAIAGINTLRLLPDMTAIGICYCFYRLNASSEQSIVAFIDVGHTNTQCAIISFGPKEIMRVLAVESDGELGGKNFDDSIADVFIKQNNLNLSKRAKLRLLAECEKLKKQMSANNNQLPIHVECLTADERDFSSRMDRASFEETIDPYLKRIENIFRTCLENAKVHYQTFCENSKHKDKLIEFKLSCVEITGGSSRVPAIKRIASDVFGMEVKTTLNADEAVASGCALQCALLSPSFKVAKDLQIYDYSPYQINCKYWQLTENESKIFSVTPLFNRGDQMPCTRLVIATCNSLPMVFELEYVGVNGQSHVIGQFKIDSRDGFQVAGNKMKVRIRLDSNGLVGVNSAVLSLPVEEKADENIPSDNSSMETDQQQQQQQGDESNPNGEDQPKQEAKKVEKPKEKLIDLSVETLWIKGSLDERSLLDAQELEAKLILADKTFKERADARNELEEYVYEWRDKIESGVHDQFITKEDKVRFLSDLQNLQDWLYEDEGQLSRSQYAERLNGMKEKYSNSIVNQIEAIRKAEEARIAEAARAAEEKAKAAMEAAKAEAAKLAEMQNQPGDGDDPQATMDVDAN